jgi:hypothetical protein
VGDGHFGHAVMLAHRQADDAAERAWKPKSRNRPISPFMTVSASVKPFSRN